MDKKLLTLMFGMFLILLVAPVVSAFDWDNGTVSYYELEETSGDVIDSHGSNNGTNNGATRGVTGKINNAFDFTRSENDYVDTFDYDTSGGWSFSMWINPETFDDWQNPLEKGNNEEFRVYVDSSGTPYLRSGDGSNAETIGGSQMSSGTWYHLVGTYDGSTMEFYQDGVSQGTSDFTDFQTNNQNMFIGTDTRGNNEGFDGKIDEVGVWNRSLSSSEVSELYNNGDGLAYSPTGKPTINLESPKNDTTFSATGTNFTVSGNNISDQGYNWTNVTYKLWKEGDDFKNKTIDFTDNSTFNETTFIDDFTLGNYEWNAKACYKNSTFSNCTSYNAQPNYTYFVGAGVQDVSYNNETYETKNEEFKVNVSLLPDVNVYSTKLIYNGTEYNANFDAYNSQEYSLIKEIDIPKVNGSTKNYTWFYRIIYELSDGSFVTQDIANNEQTVKPINMGECGGSLTTQTMNFTTYDEENMTRIKPYDFYGTFEYWLGKGNIKKKFSLDNPDVNETTICIDPDNETYKSFAHIQYEKEGYIKRSHYLLERELTNESQDEYLYFLDTDASTSFTITIYDENQVALPGVYLDMKRYYPGTDQTNTIEMSKTDTSGQSVGHFEAETENYKILVKEKDGTVLFESDTFKPFCEGTECSIEFSLESEIEDEWRDVGNITDLTSKFSFNENTSILSYLYVDDDEDFEQSRLYVYNKNPGSGKETICNKTSTLSSDTITCNVTGYDKIVGEAFVTRGGGEIYVGNFVYDAGDLSDKFGKEGLFLSIFILAVIALVGLWNPSVSIILMMVGVILVDFIGLASFGVITKFGVIAGGLILLWILKT